MSDVLLIVVIGTIIFLLLTFLIIILTFLYQRRRYQYQEEVLIIQENYQQEILKAQLEMQEQTFLNISQEIHDNIGQILSLTRLNISTIDPNSPTEMEQKITDSKALLDKAIQDLRDLSKGLNNKFVIQQSLTESLSFQLNLINKTGLYNTKIDVQGEEKAINSEKKLIIFRIAQEAINNIIKHADAKNIWITLKYLPDKIILNIEDDGKGFEVSDVLGKGLPQKGIGTHNMYYRANLIGGQFSIQSNFNTGTIAQLIAPTQS
jgi:signal transduction histidine kinase